MNFTQTKLSALIRKLLQNYCDELHDSHILKDGSQTIGEIELLIMQKIPEDFFVVSASKSIRRLSKM